MRTIVFRRLPKGVLRQPFSKRVLDGEPLQFSRDPLRGVGRFGRGCVRYDRKSVYTQSFDGWTIGV
ncbi:hypothetical protein CV102_09670 [Natronococcus pandeyae]|uniref:Uncharacterized protein n=1 Tax=Natronococcus pandeyae TaxID=2055836 RepID=A0A8J8Q5B8_9EURY|nr:hypothetical protein CV102_09670 [Natronococcus pandeyae]